MLNGDATEKEAMAASEARMAALEGAVGQIYLTVLVARLVGLHIVHATREKS